VKIRFLIALPRIVLPESGSGRANPVSARTGIDIRSVDSISIFRFFRYSSISSLSKTSRIGLTIPSSVSRGIPFSRRSPPPRRGASGSLSKLLVVPPCRASAIAEAPLFRKEPSETRYRTARAFFSNPAGNKFRRSPRSAMGSFSMFFTSTAICIRFISVIYADLLNQFLIFCRNRSRDP